MGDWESINFLAARKLRRLFYYADNHRERVSGLTKSLMVCAPRAIRAGLAIRQGVAPQAEGPARLARDLDANGFGGGLISARSVASGLALLKLRSQRI